MSNHLNKKNKNKNKKNNDLPFVSICTPTFNRRPFFQMIIKCFLSQTYPIENMEWVIIDDGTDKIEDLIEKIPQVKYFKYEEKMTLGKKRNLMHEKSKGEIIIYMDDDDYYPPERVSHAVKTLMDNPTILIAGSSEMYIYFNHISKMYQFGPYGKNHATAATFAFKRELLKDTSYDENAALAEEKYFLKNYSIPFIQLDPLKTILVFSHQQNSFDKKELLSQPESQFMKVSNKTINDFIKDESIKTFFMTDIDNLLQKYEPGNIKYKPEVLKQIDELKEKRSTLIQQQMGNQLQELTVSNNKMNKILEDNCKLVKILMRDNVEMKRRLSELENKIR
jgi:glycosyltransferase involved in cell wall biosynthesis